MVAAILCWVLCVGVVHAQSYGYPVTDLSVYSSWLDLSKIGPQPITGDGLDGDYYVAPDGNDSNPGTMSQPFKTINKAASVAKPGDTIYVRGGRYYGGVKISGLHGTAENPIVFSAFPGEEVIIDGHDDYLPASHSNYIFLIQSNASYLIFDGFTITDTSPKLDAARALNLSDPNDVDRYWNENWDDVMEDEINSAVRTSTSSDGSIHHITFRNFKIYHVGGMGFELSMLTKNIVIENTLIEDLGYPRSGYGVYYHNEDFVFRNNIVNGATYGLHLYTGSSNPRRMDGTIIENNVFLNIGVRPYYHLSSNDIKPSGGVAILADSPGDSVMIRNNYVENASICVRVDVSDSWVVHNELVRCNTAILIEEPGVHVINNIFTNSLSGAPATNIGTSRSRSDVVARSEYAPTDMFGRPRAETTSAGPVDSLFAE